MNKTHFKFSLKLLFVVIASVSLLSKASAEMIPMTGDSDIAGERVVQKNLIFGNARIAPDQIIAGNRAAGLNLQFVRRVKGIETPVEGIVIKNQKSDSTGTLRSADCSMDSDESFKFSSARFDVVGSSGVYELFFRVKCGVFQKIIFEEQSPAGEVVAIWQIAFHAEKKLQENVGVDFWKKKITLKFPAAGDYYAFGSVNLTFGHRWDVVSHELGHAIYDQAKIGVFGGGEHKIDECYSNELGVSEGWASFFAAWVNIDLNDPDAKFEYMVPRRAPIQVENVPADVCREEESEWRAFSFLWDLIDLHSDGEDSNGTFQQLWLATLNKKVSSSKEIKNHLLSLGWNREKVELIWKLNFPAAQRTN